MLTNPLCYDSKDFKAFPDKILKHIPVQFQSFDIALEEGQCTYYKGEVITQISPLSELPVFNPGSEHSPLGKQSILLANAAVGSCFLKGEKSTRVLLIKGLCSKFRMHSHVKVTLSTIDAGAGTCLGLSGSP